MDARVTGTKAAGMPAIIATTEPSAWVSCKVIAPNLAQAYQKALGKDVHHFGFDYHMNHRSRRLIGLDVRELAKRIHAARPDRLVFIDHQPHPALLISALSDIYGSRPLPPLYFHVYGDFTLFGAEWASCEAILRGTRIALICASDRQRALVSRMLMQEPDGEAAVFKCHFPVDTTQYHYEARLRERTRARYGIAKDELAFLYTGRISLQKNVIPLAREVERFAKSVRRPCRLLLAGQFDDLGAPLFGARTRPGFYFQQWQRFLAELPPNRRGSYQYLGSFGPEELRGLYHAADAYVSLSLHHDEDFGMSPIEALCSGTPAILSDWGGYASFRRDWREGGDCRLAPVSILREGLSIDAAALRRSFEALAAGVPESAATRAERSRDYRGEYSIDAAQKRILEIHAARLPTFPGFNWRLQELAKASRRAIGFFPTGPRHGTFYEEIYGAYASPLASGEL